MNIDAQDWLALLQSPLFALTLSVAAFSCGRWLFYRCREFPLLHPTLSGAGLAALALIALDIDYAHYQQGNQLLLFLLGPTTVALAVPLYQQLHHIRGMVLPLLLTAAVGAVFAAASAVAIAWLLGGNTQTLLSLAPKSVTTPIAISIAEESGGLATLAAGAVALSAVFAILLGPLVFRLTRLGDPRLWGFCFGITGHGMATARAFELNPTAGAFSSLAMCLTGSFSAVLIPVAVSLLR